MSKHQEYWNILNSIQDGIRYSDTKATIILTLYGVTLTIVYSNSHEVLTAIETSNSVFFSSIAAIICAAISILFAFLCVNPRLIGNNPTSIIYFGHIQERYSTYSDYLSKANEILSDDSRYSAEISEQIHSNSKIAWQKFSNVAWCIRFLFACIVFLIISLLAYLL